MLRVSWICLLLLGTAVAVAAEPAEKLGKPYSISVGDMVALKLPQVLAVVGPTGAAVLTAYDKSTETITVFVYGGQYSNSVDEGKKVLEKYREKLADPVARLLDGMYGVKLDDKDFTLIFYSNGKEIVRREAGQYVIR